MKKFIPTIGEKGHYRLAQPFELGPNDYYCCKSIRKISELTSSGLDVFTEFYEPKGLSLDVYEEHAAEDIEIIGLMSDEGHWVYVPSTYMLGYPNMNGVAYRTYSLVAELPAFPVDQNFESIKEEIADIVRSILGVTPVVSEVVTSKTLLIETDNHERLRIERLNNGLGGTTYMQMLQWKRAYEELLTKHQALLNEANFR